MGRKSKTFALLLLFGFIASLTVLLQNANANFYHQGVTLPEITILSNGTIQSSLNPSPITNEGNIYTINENISGYAIDIQRSNIIVQGSGNTLQATNKYNGNAGITIDANGVTVENLIITEYETGIYIVGNSNQINGIIISREFDRGMLPGEAIRVSGQQNSISENYINCSSSGGITLTNSMNNIDANTLDNCGIYIDWGSNNNTVSRNLLRFNGAGITLWNSSFNNIIGNTITDSRLIVYDSDQTPHYYGTAIELYFNSTANVVSGNNIINNYIAVSLNKEVNYFYLNNFINNSNSVLFVLYNTNIFDNGSMGNYWDDYTAKYPNAQEIGNSGVYNTPYIINRIIPDNYPLTSPYNVGRTGAQLSTTSSPNPTSTPTVPDFNYRQFQYCLLLWRLLVCWFTSRNTTRAV